MGTAGFCMSAAALACLRVGLAHLFEQAVGLDPDAGMLAESCRAAEEAVMNIRVGPGPGRGPALDGEGDRGEQSLFRGAES
jgi:hypothetical protein